MKSKAIIKRMLCVLMVVLTVVTSAPVTGFVGVGEAQALPDIEGKEYGTPVPGLVWPVKGSTSISQGFHGGSIDITGNGKTVVAAQGGTVVNLYTCKKNHSTDKNYNGDGKGIKAACCGGFGTGLVIRGSDDRYYWYAHMQGGSIPSSITKEFTKGNKPKVARGATIGKIGNTGNSYGAHLHFGISKKSNIDSESGWVDPLSEDYLGATVKNKYFKSASVEKVKSNDATIRAKILKMDVKSIGFYFGTDKNNMKKYTEKYSGSLKEFWYPLKKWCGTLKANTTYYYRFWINVNGEEKKSELKSFKTSSASNSTSTYTFAYSANGGSGSMSSQSVVKGKSFTVKANAFTRSGYIFNGYTVQRKSDGKWFVSGKGWRSDAEITKNKWNKKIYAEGTNLTTNSSWQNGSKANETFTFFAQWKVNKCTSHKWDGGKVTKAATTVKTGVKTYTCTNCKATKTETIARSTTEKYFSSVYANNIKTNDAKIGGNAKSTAYKKGTGFYFGTSKDSMKRYTKNLKGQSDAAGSYTSIFFTLSGWYGKLKPGTTYYYSVFYIDKNGNECASVIKSFKTSGTSSSGTTCTSHKWDSGKVTKAATTVKTGVKTYTCTNCKATKTETIARSTTEKYFSSTYANNIKTNDAKIGGNAKSTAYKKGTGFYFGTSKDSMKRYTKNLKGKSDAAGSYTSIFFTLSGWYGKLKPKTTYYYSIFYIDKNGNECASVIKSFKTK